MWGPVIAAAIVQLASFLVYFGVFWADMRNVKKRLDGGDDTFKEHGGRIGSLEVDMGRVKLATGINGSHSEGIH